MFAFSYHNPVKIHMGRGTFQVLGEAAARHGKKALIVSTGSAHSAKLVEEATQLLRKNGVAAVHYPGIRPNPLGDMAGEGARLALAKDCDLILGIGGGSVMDASKGIALCAGGGGEIFDYIYGRRQPTQSLPIVLVTTTAGTGSEGNWTAVFTDPQSKAKKGLFSPLIFPKESIVDPLLLTSLPPRQIAGPGFDALAHAIESYISVRANAMSQMYSLQAIRWLMNCLPQVYADPSNLDAWDKVAFANTLAGMAIGNAGCTAPHGLEHPVSGLLDVMHGEGLAVLYTEYLRFILPQLQAPLAKIAQAMGEEGLTESAAAGKVLERVDGLLRKFHLDMRLSSLGVRSEHLDWLAEQALETMPHVFGNDPMKIGVEEVRSLYARSL